MADELDAVLEHYGIKGMRWGVRKSAPKPKAPDLTPTDVLLKRTADGKYHVEGGRNQPYSEDAKKVAASRQKARASGVHSLSNQEIRDLITRLELENKYNQVRKAEIESQKSAGRKFFENFVESEKKTVIGGKTPQTIKLLEAVSNMSSGAPGKHAKKK